VRDRSGAVTPCAGSCAAPKDRVVRDVHSLTMNSATRSELAASSAFRASRRLFSFTFVPLTIATPDLTGQSDVSALRIAAPQLVEFYREAFTALLGQDVV
jgi:hypothetical protein